MDILPPLDAEHPRPVRLPVAPTTGPASGRPAEVLRVLEPTLADYAWSVLQRRWMVLGVAALAMVLACAYLLVASPVYEASSLIEVVPKHPELTDLEDAPKAPTTTDREAEDEVELVRSRSVVGAVVDALHLDVDAWPRTFPLVGRALARRYRGRGLAPPVLGLGGFAWGGERIAVGTLEVPDALLGVPLVLTAEGDGRYRLAAPGGATLLTGSVGKTAPPAQDHGVTLAVPLLVARPGTEFFLEKRHREDVVDGLRRALAVGEVGHSSAIVIQMEGQDPVRLAETVNLVADTALRQSAERSSTEAAQELAFVETQLPTLKANADKAEAALNGFMHSRGTVDPSAETTTLLARSAELEKDISDLKLKRAELRQLFRDNHPSVVAVSDKLAVLTAEQAALKAEMHQLPTAEVDAARLTRELKDARELYGRMLDRSEELRMAQSAKLGDVRIIDRAHAPVRPSRPRSAPVLALALFLGLGGGVALALVRGSLAQCAEDAEDVERGTGLPVYVTVPHSDSRDARGRVSRRDGVAQSLALAGPMDSALEAIRSLRTSLQFALVGSKHKVVALTGPSPGVGKSFVSLYLAHACASDGRKVLLIDGDLRRGGLHRDLGLDRQPGLSEVLSGAVSLDSAVHEVAWRLHALTSGRYPPNPAELLSSRHFELLLAAAAGRYDFVVVDTPPLLAVSDAMLVARLADVNFLVLRAGAHTLREIELAMKQFALNGIRLQGAVLNDVQVAHGRYGRFGRYVRYEYP